MEKAFSAMTRAGAKAFMGLTDTRFSVNRQRIVELSAKNRLPVVFPERAFVESGGLMSYRTNRVEFRRRIAVDIDKILKGAKPAELPIEQPVRVRRQSENRQTDRRDDSTECARAGG